MLTEAFRFDHTLHEYSGEPGIVQALVDALEVPY